MNLEDKVRADEKRRKKGEAILDERIAAKEGGNGKDHSEDALELEPDDWPEPLSGEAYHGLAGEIVNFILPQSESDASALLMQTLVAFGALVGRGAYYQVEATRHYPNLFMLLVGGTSKARKGTSWDRVLSVFSLVHEWVKTTTGLSSGEGFKYLVRDARPMPKKKQRGRRAMRHCADPDYEEEEEDEAYLARRQGQALARHRA